MKFGKSYCSRCLLLVSIVSLLGIFSCETPKSGKKSSGDSTVRDTTQGGGQPSLRAPGTTVDTVRSN